MKKITLLLSFMACVAFTQAQTETIYLETCGTVDVSTSADPNYRPKVELYTGWDKTAPITYTRTTTLDGYADVRKTSSTTNHIWFPAGKGSDLIISNIPASGYENLKLSFDVATNAVANSNANKVAVFINGTQLTNIPSQTFSATNTFITVADLAISKADVISIKFEYTATSNPTGIGYRLDNFKITGDKIAGLNDTEASKFKAIVSGSDLVIKNVTNGSTVEIFSALGNKVQTSVLENGKVELNNLSRGMYVVRVGKSTQKFML
jgi:hypothetical protein